MPATRYYETCNRIHYAMVPERAMSVLSLHDRWRVPAAVDGEVKMVSLKTQSQDLGWRVERGIITKQ